jgi:hypothetical protein
MICERTGLVLASVWFALLLGLTGCEHEVVVVPPRSEALGSLNLDQKYALQNKTEMDALSGTDAQPTVDLEYWKNQLPPAEAFERVELPVEPSDAYWSSVQMDADTQMSLSSVVVYNNTHVYIGRITSGGLSNTHILLVVPIADAVLPSLDELQAEDRSYLVPIGSPATQPATGGP